MTATPRTLLVMAGGTGGHVFPGLAVADYVRAQGWRVVWMGNPNGMEAALVPSHGYEMAWVRFSALRGKGLMRKILLPFNLLGGCGQAMRALARVKPDVVLGMGGYVTFPGGLMAALTGRPLVVHEQNSVAGLANRVLALVASRVLAGFPLPMKKAEWTGNPVRAAISALPTPAQRYGERNAAGSNSVATEGKAGEEGKDRLNVLVVGGSLGAHALNTIVPKALALLPETERPNVTHQSGAKNIQALNEAYLTAGVQATLVNFIDDMAASYANADLVICRSGALTVAELTAAGVASVLVPFPNAVDDHQTRNARFLSEAGAAVLMPQTELTPDSLARLLRVLARDQLMVMAQKARALAKPEATRVVAEICMGLAK